MIRLHIAMKLIKRLFTCCLFTRKKNKIHPIPETVVVEKPTSPNTLQECIICYDKSTSIHTKCCKQYICTECIQKANERTNRCPHCRQVGQSPQPVSNQVSNRSDIRLVLMKIVSVLGYIAIIAVVICL